MGIAKCNQRQKGFLLINLIPFDWNSQSFLRNRVAIIVTISLHKVAPEDILHRAVLLITLFLCHIAHYFWARKKNLERIAKKSHRLLIAMPFVETLFSLVSHSIHIDFSMNQFFTRPTNWNDGIVFCWLNVTMWEFRDSNKCANSFQSVPIKNLKLSPGFFSPFRSRRLFLPLSLVLWCSLAPLFSFSFQ